MTRLEHLQIHDVLPDEDICHCTTSTPVLLRYAFTKFPVFCATCTGQVFPAAFELPEELAGEIVSWRSVYAALYDLWLASSSYEEFARASLSDPDGEVNQMGLRLAVRLSEQRKTYYWWFRAEPDLTVESCPVCAAPLEPHPTRNFAYCHPCHLAL